MATTTNYSWTTPDDTGLVKDGASAIRTLGSSIDTTTKALNPSTTLGDIEYRSSTANTNTRLGIGTTGQVLTVAGGVPSWATLSTAAANSVATVATAQTTTSTSYTDLATAGPAITLTTGTKALVIVSAAVRNSSAGVSSYMSFAVSGATTIAANDANAYLTFETDYDKSSFAIIITGLTAGSNTFTAKYRTAAGTATFVDRNINVIDMGS